jgi:FkbM family methyltransferase
MLVLTSKINLGTVLFLLTLSIKVFAVDNSEEELIKICKRDITTIFDVGAHSGEWTDICLKYNPDSQFYLFEPASYLSKVLIQKYRAHNNVSIFRLGLSNKNGSLILYNPGSPLAGYHFRPGCHDPNITESIPVMTIDSFTETMGIDHIDLLKIDTEGAELDILQGAHRLLASKHIDVIQFEYGGTYLDANITLKVVYELLSSYGYKILKLETRKIVPVDSWNPLLESYCLTNYCAYLPGQNLIDESKLGRKF